MLLYEHGIVNIEQEIELDRAVPIGCGRSAAATAASPPLCGPGRTLRTADVKRAQRARSMRKNLGEV